MLATSVGKKQSMNVSSTFGNGPNPNHTTNSGATAILGISWKKTINGYSDRSSHLNDTIISPSGTPIAAAKTNPSRTSLAVTSVCCQISARDSTSLDKNSVGRGRMYSGTPNSRTRNCQATSSAAKVTIGNSTAEMRSRALVGGGAATAS